MYLNDNCIFLHNPCCQAQYIFIHDALDDLITCGETAFNVQSLRVKVSKMSKVIPGTDKTGYQEQFEVRMYMYELCI